MAVFNAEAFLAEAIESVLAQQWTSWELILVDDGSRDGSPAIARIFAAGHPGRIRYLEPFGGENRGPGAALNVALAAARGRYVAILDADDVWLPGRLAAHVPLLDAHPAAGMLYGNTVFWHSWTRRAEDDGRDFTPALGVPTDGLVPGQHLLSKMLEGTAAAPCTCSLLVRRDLLRRVGGWEESLRVYEDQAVYAKLLLEGPAYVAAGVHDRYRIHPGSTLMTAKRAGTVGDHRSRFLAFLERYCRERDRTTGAVWRTLRRERWQARFPTAAARLARLRRAPAGVRRRLRAHVTPRMRRALRPVGGMRFGSLRRLTPWSRAFGFDRGQPVDRHYIEGFLAAHAADVHGRVLEVGDDTYTRRFGGDRVTRADVLHVHDGHPAATIVDDLAVGSRIPDAAFDCIVLTQTLQLVFDLPAAVATLHRALAPGGVVLATVPGITPVPEGTWRATWYWALTPTAARRLFGERFGPDGVEVRSFGNVLAATAFLQGLASEELRPHELDANDAAYPVVVTIRACKRPS
jgi:glycosyltransferase involved in cell wall biosynthesis